MRHANVFALARVILAVLLVSPTVVSASSAEFNQLVKDASQLYEAGKYKESAEKLIEAYAYEPNPRLIYNIAKAYDQAGELDSALEYYQRYVGSKEGTDPKLLKLSASSIDRLRSNIAQRDEAKKKQEEDQARVEAEAKAAKERAEQETLAKQKAEEELRTREKAAAEARAKSQKTGKIAAFTLGGVAVVGLGAGAFFGIRANQSKNDFKSAATVADKQRLESDTKTNALIADVGMGAGIVAAVLAVVMYPKGSAEPETSTQVTLVPAPGGAGVEVRF